MVEHESPWLVQLPLILALWSIRTHYLPSVNDRKAEAVYAGMYRRIPRLKKKKNLRKGCWGNGSQGLELDPYLHMKSQVWRPEEPYLEENLTAIFPGVY